MIVLKGKSVYKGIALGRLLVKQKSGAKVKRSTVADVEQEINRLSQAIFIAQAELQKLYEKAKREVGEESAAIFEVHGMLLEDEDYQLSIQNMIRDQKVNAEFAVNETGKNFSNMFAAMDDDYMRARATDILDISKRVINVLQNTGEIFSENVEPFVLAADDLTPSETMQIDRKKILAFVTVHGSENSHTSILARALNIPAMIGVDIDLENLKNGTMVLVDSYTEQVIIDPDAVTLKEAQKKIAVEKQKADELHALIGQENVTLDGVKVNVFANIGNAEDAKYAIENDAGGIGLFRSEFLYLGRDDFPSEEEQYYSYKKVLTLMGDKKVVIRTLDIGADKQVDYFNLGKETNPAMGYRAIRICLTRTAIFKTQLRALLRAAVFGNLSIMYPMITSVEEVKKIQSIVKEVADELQHEGVPYQIPEQGIMIETPAAVIISDELAQLVDFFSIGTNDLTQYTLAIDRQNANLSEFYNPHHTAILRMIEMTIKNAHKYGKWAGICGELGADTALTEQFLRMGVDELSVSSSMILKLRKTIRKLDLSKAPV
jgi:phosphotransferase system enzyme I (PtsI)